MSGSADRPVMLVVPCFNEAARLPAGELAALAANPDVGLVLVDDGSTDGTLDLLNRLAKEVPAVAVVHLATNQGKAEAVRRGLLRALEGRPEVVGFVDADFATPAFEVLRLAAGIRQPGAPDVVIGSRVLLSGRTVVRRPVRHILGRIVATYLSLTYALQIYDTQCGAKLFRADERLRHALDAPFATRWLFDVELLMRVRDTPGPPAAVREEPLEEWRDIPGSRLAAREVGQVLKDFRALHLRHGRDSA
ncbi:MAG: glycosyltransferase [Frankiaceae bacterium]|nr:glycosyltransferase [Frankiaceae bacterium]